MKRDQLSRQIRSLACAVLGAMVGLQPLGNSVVMAAQKDSAQFEQLHAAADRMGIDTLQLADPQAYQDRDLAQHAALHEQALAELDRASRPAPEKLAAAKDAARSVKNAHAQSAVNGINSALENLSRRLESPGMSAAEIGSYRELVRSALEDLQRLQDSQSAQLQPMAAQRLNAFAAELRARLSDIEHLLASVPQNATQDQQAAVMAELHSRLNRNSSTAVTPKAAPVTNGLPYGPVTSQAGAPRVTRADYLLSEKQFSAPALLLRYAANPLRLNDLLAALQQVYAQVSPAAPGGPLAAPLPADLQESPDVHFTPDVVALASSLGSPLAMFNYVRDQIDTEVYYGSKKGSTGALYELAGNDFDQGSLLIAIYRAAGIPARYATGRVWLSPQQAMDLARTQTGAAAADVLSSAGIPSIYVSTSGGRNYVEIEHTWVQAWLPYERYRGLMAPGPVPPSGWIDLDPFIKSYTFNTPAADLRTIAAFDPISFITSAAITSNTLPLDYWANNLRSYIQANGLSCSTLEAATRFRTLVPMNDELLPAELPVVLRTMYATPSVIASSQRYQIQVTLEDDYGYTDMAWTSDLPPIYGLRLDLSYPGSTATDQATIDHYGGIFNAPAYAISLKPTLKLSETVVATGTDVTGGASRNLRVSFSTPNVSSDVSFIVHNTTAGGLYVIGTDYQTVPQRLIDEAQVRYATLAASNAASNNAQAQKLYATLLTYFRDTDKARDLAIGVLQNGYIRDVGAGFASVEASALTSWYGTVSAVTFDGYQVDVGKQTYTFYDQESGGQTRSFKVGQITGYQSSALEHFVLQKAYNFEGVSAVKALQVAALRGQPILTLTDASQVNGLGISAASKTSILDAMSRGWHAIVSQNSIVLNRWNGEGYVIFDPVLGSGSYEITGGLNGGGTTGGGSGSGGDCGKGDSSGCEAGLDAMLDSFIQAAQTIAGDPVNLSNGNFLADEKDLLLQARGVPLAWERFYNSIDAAATPTRLGYGWLDSFSAHIITGTTGSRSYIARDGHEYIYAPDGAGGFVRPAGLRMELTKTLTSYVLSDMFGTSLTFDSSGRLLSMDDGSGNTITLNYAGGLLSSITDASGRTAFTFTSDGNRRITSVSSVDGRSVQYGYDVAGDLRTVTDSTGVVFSYTYDAAHRIIRTQDGSGAVNLYAYDGNGRMTRHVDPLGQVESFAFDPYNGRATVTNRAGDDTTFQLDGRGRTTGTIDPSGDKVARQWDADNNIVGTTDDQGRQYSAAFNDKGEVISTTNAAGQTDLFGYDARGLQVSHSVPTAGGTLVETNQYNAQGYLTSHTDLAGRSITVMRDANGQITGTADSAGGAHQYVLNTDGTHQSDIASMRDADGNAVAITVTYAYTAGGLLKSTVDGGGRVFDSSSDALGRVQAASTAGRGISMGFDGVGRVAAITTSLGFTMAMAYDGRGQLRAQTDSLNRLNTFTYTPHGDVASRTDARGRVSRYLYDSLGRMVRTINPDGSSTGSGYCAGSAQACKEVDENGVTRSIVEDAASRPITSTDGLGNTTLKQYDALGRVSSLTDALGRVTSFTYDGSGNLLQVTNALGKPTLYGYDARGNFASMTDAKGRTRNFTYDLRGRLIRETDALNHLTRSYYDGNDNLLKTIDANGTQVAYTYDANGRLLNDSVTDSFTWSPDGRRLSASNSTTAMTYGYDRLGQLVTSTQTISGSLVKTVVYSYTIDGQIAGIVNPEGGVTSYAYDAMNRVTSITDPAGRATQYAYDPTGRRIRASLPNGVMVFYSYDNEDHLTALVAKNSGGALVAAYSYTYDALGRRTKMVDINGQTTTYVYDALSRLISVAYGNGRTQSFTYDDVGNRLTQTVNGVTTSYTYDAADRLTSETTGGQTTTYTYDNNSNRLSQTTGANTTAYTYDPFNQLTRLNSPDGSSFTFGYAADHKRVFEQFTPTGGAPARTDFVQAFGSVLAEYSPGGTTHNVSGPQTDELISQERNGQITYYVQDALGSVTVALDASGNVTGRRTYDAFGIPIDQSGVWPGRYSFTGREDIGATGLLYYRARVYDARSGRFITTDPVGATPSQPDSWNRFAYAQNDPVNLRDPSGESVAGVVAPIWTDFIDYVVNTLLFDVLKNSFKGLCKFNFYCQIGNSVIAAYEIYFTFLASFSTLLFTYGDMPNSDRAIYFITFVWPFLAEFVAAVEYFTYKDFTGWSWAFIQKAVKKVIVQTALKIFEFLVAEAAKALAKPYYKYIVDAYKVVAEVLKWLVLVVDGKAITDSPWKAGATILKLLLAPEIALLITVKIPALFGH